MKRDDIQDARHETPRRDAATATKNTRERAETEEPKNAPTK